MRGDDGLARPSVDSLIRELENNMQGRGSNHMNITGMDLAIVKTLMNHVNRLQDRIETLEGQISVPVPPDVKRNPEYETPVKKAKVTAADTGDEQEVYDNHDVTRFETLKSDLQKLYGGRAQEYDPTARNTLYPPHGMCHVDIILKSVDQLHDKIKDIDKEIARLEQELKKHPYTPNSPHPMIVLQPGNPQNNDSHQTSRSIETRNQLVRDIAKQEGVRRILKEDMDFWSTVKPASIEYMQQIQCMFVEKNQLRKKLLEVYGLRPSAW